MFSRTQKNTHDRHLVLDDLEKPSPSKHPQDPAPDIATIDYNGILPLTSTVADTGCVSSREA